MGVSYPNPSFTHRGIAKRVLGGVGRVCVAVTIFLMALSPQKA